MSITNSMLELVLPLWFPRRVPKQEWKQCSSRTHTRDKFIQLILYYLFRSLAVEWARYGMRFVGIAPGPIETEGAFSRLDPTGEFRKQMLANSAVGRLGESRELANLASYLVSDYASWCTGEIVTLDGGESVAMAGEFNQLRAVPDQMWDHIEKSIRSGKK